MRIFSYSKWEKSYFGGYRKVVRDLPYINLSYHIDITLGDTSDLDNYDCKKVIKCFLYDSKNFKFEFQKGTRKRFHKDVETLEITKDSLEKAIKYLSKDEKIELRNLYTNYKEMILDSTISTDIEDEEDLESEDGNPGEPGKREKKKEDPLHEHFRQLLGKTDLYSSKTYEFYNPNIVEEDVPYTVLEMQEGEEVQLTKEEEKLKEELLKLLDIRTDPGLNILNNLRFGKIDGKKLAEAVALNERIFYKTERFERMRPFKVVLLGDYSGSMEGTPVEEQMSLMKSLYAVFSTYNCVDTYVHTSFDRYNTYNRYKRIESETFERKDGEDDRCGIYKLSGENLSLYKTCSNLEEEVPLLQNYDGEVFRYLNKRYGNSDDAILIISISDGEPAGYNYGGNAAMNKLIKELEKCRRNNIITLGIGIDGYDVGSLYKYNLTIKNISRSSAKISNIINTIIKQEFVL